MNEAITHPLVKQLVNLFVDKNRLLRAFLDCTQAYYAKFKQEYPVEMKMDWVDELSDVRETNVKALQLLDQQIEAARSQLNHQLNNATIEKLQGDEFFRNTLEETFTLIREIQLTDKSLFLYIQNMGFELRSQILKSLKEKEAVSKFKSQAQAPTGEGLDHTV
jgi:Mor family transcriptional regulator